MKFCPRRSDLQTEAGAISYPDRVAGTVNKHGYLKGFTENLLKAALDQMRKAYGSQSSQITK